MRSAGRLTQQPFQITQITWLEALVRRLTRTLLVRKASGVAPVTLREALRVLLRLEHEHAAAGQVRNFFVPRGSAPVRTALPRAESAHGERYRFFLDRIGEDGVSGWVLDTQAPQQPVEVDLYLEGELVRRARADHERADVAALGLGGSRGGFWFGIPARYRGRALLRVRLCPAGAREPFDGCEYWHTARDAVLGTLVQAAQAMKRAGEPQALRQAVFAPLLERLRAEWASLPEVQAVAFRAAPDAERVDVIVPAYRGAAETVRCIESVLAAKGAAGYELTVINDCSPEPALTEALRTLAARHGFRLLENARNLGFVRSVNLGMRLHPDRDVVLLNSDTEVADGWLDRLRDAALRDADVASVTPLSNSATICSFPRGAEDNALPQGFSLAEIAQQCARVNRGVAIDLPTAVGFCMYIRRAALREAGLFDAERWGKGYGEENEFCLRAAALGWRHVAACDAFVLHHGSLSFGGENSARKRANQALLDSLYPDYSAAVARFIRADPLGPARRRLFLALAKARAPRYMLHVTHRWGGGAQAAAADLAARLAKRGEAVLFLSALEAGGMRLEAFGAGLSCDYRGPHALAWLLADLRGLGVWHVHVHQLGGFGAELYGLPAQLGVPYDVTLHDHFHLCPRLDLAQGERGYCGEPDASGCRACLAANGPHEFVRELYAAAGEEIGAWRARHAQFLAGARRVVAPSEDVARRHARYFRLERLAVKPHPERVMPIGQAPEPAAGTVNVALIGAIGVQKGYYVLEACAEDARARGLPLRFVVVGYTCDDERLRALPNVAITGKYAPAELDARLKEHGCTLAAFFSISPETYSYTLSEAWRHGLYPLVFDLGAQAERVRAVGYGEVMPFPSAPAEINDRLLRAATRRPQSAPGALVGNDYPDVLADYYELGIRAQGAARVA
jgi:GT2 family glycosyltransferase